MVSLKDISKASGISVTQVSRALNNHDDVSEETKQKVKETAKKLGYVKNITAQRLATKDSKQMAIIVHGLEEDNNRFMSDGLLKNLKGINRFAISVNYEPIIHLVDKSEFSYIDFCRQRGISGVIILGAKFDNKDFQTLLQSDFPCVAMDIPIQGINKGCVIVNNQSYAKMCVRHMIEKGRTHLAMIGGHEHAMVNVERYLGFLEALKEANLKVYDELVVNADFDFDKAYEQTQKIMSHEIKPDGIFCASDVMAMGCMKALTELQYRIGIDISVIGFDGIPYSEFTTPPLTTVKQDDFQKGYACANLLFNILTKKSNYNTLVVDCDFIVRSSV